MDDPQAVPRTHTWNRFKEEIFDLCVIGGGINGAGIARDAALRGLNVALIEKKDFGWGTSSRSSKLIHGGLRYLEHYKLGLVKESLRERVVLMNIAPHLVHPLPFLIPIYKGEKPPALIMRLGLVVYDLLSLGKRVGSHSWYSIKKFKKEKLEPKLKTEGLKGVGRYFDCQSNDARMTLETVLSAQEHGAAVLNYTEAIDFHAENNKLQAMTVRNLETLEACQIQANVFVNASGPWADITRFMEDSNAEQSLANSKGSHIIVMHKKIGIGNHAIAIPMRDGRLIFVVPFGFDYALIGTTDIFYGDDLNRIYCSAEEVDYLIEGYNHLFPSNQLSKADVISTYAGVRPLVFDPKHGANASDVSREHKISVNETGLITIVGGKFTTYRRMGKTITDLVIKTLKQQKKLPSEVKKCVTNKTPLFGGEIKDWNTFEQEEVQRLATMYQLSKDILQRLLRLYGSKLADVLALSKENQEWLEQILPDHPYLIVQIIYSIRVEMARSLDDFFWRRTFIALETNFLPCLDTVAEIFGLELGWEKDKILSEKKNVENLGRRIQVDHLK